MQKIKSLLALLLLVAGVTYVNAGSFPAAGLQFPYYAYTSTAVTNVGTTETNLWQVSIPQQALGNSGFLRITLFEKSTDAQAGASHTYKVYMGGTGNPVSGGTALFTNAVFAAPSAGVQRTVFMNGGLSAGFAIGDNSTNSFTGFTTASIPLTFSTSTNFNITVTGAGQFSTNIFGLDGAIVEIFSGP
jgi:hypothetical protein